jgi:hypothetical protein
LSYAGYAASPNSDRASVHIRATKKPRTMPGLLSC